MNTEQKNKSKLRSLPRHGMNSKTLVLSLSICALMLSGCASSPTVIAPSCPEPVPIPVTLFESDLPAAQNYSKKVQNYLQKVQDFLSR